MIEIQIFGTEITNSSVEESNNFIDSKNQPFTEHAINKTGKKNTMAWHDCISLCTTLFFILFHTGGYLTHTAVDRGIH